MPDNNKKSVFDTIKENKAKGIEHKIIPTAYSPTLEESGYVRPEQSIDSYGQSKYDTQYTQGYFQPSGDNGKLEYDYLRGERQSNLEKWGVGISKAVSKLGVRTLNGIVSPLYGVGSAIANWDTSKLWDNEVSAYTSEVEKNIDKEFGLYSTKAADEAKGFSKLAHVNFWANDVLDGMSYSGAAMLSGGVWAKALKSIGSLSMFGKAKASNLIDESAQLLDKVDDQIKYVNDLSGRTRLLKDGLKNGSIAALGASTEASVEAYNGANEWEKQMIQQISVNPDGSYREPSQEELDHIKEMRKSVGNTQYALNLPVIMASNWLTFGKAMLGNKVTERASLKQLGERLVKDEAQDAWKLGTVSKVRQIIDKTYGARKALGKAIPEGFEELEQFAVEKGTNDYYTKKYYNPDNASFIESMAAGIHAAMTTEGLEQFLVGAISGGIFGNATALRTEGVKSYKNPYTGPEMQNALDYINKFKSKDSFKQTVEMLNRHANISADLEKSFKENDDFEIANNRSDMFVNYTNHMINMGKTNELKDELESYKKLSPENFEDILGLKLDVKQGTTLKESVGEYINKRLEKISKIEDLSNKIDELAPQAKQNIKDRLLYTAWSLEDARDRTLQLNNEVKNLVANELQWSEDSFKQTDIETNRFALDSLRKDYLFLTDKQDKKEYKEVLDKANISPFIKDRIEKKINDLDKLLERRDTFIKEYKSLNNPLVQELLTKLDEEAEQKVSDTIVKENENKTTAEDKSKAEQQTHEGEPQSSDEVDLYNILKGNVPADVEAATVQTANKQDIEAKKADIEKRRQEEIRRIATDPKREPSEYNAYVTRINEIYDEELAALENNKSTKVVVDSNLDNTYDDISATIVDTDRNHIDNNLDKQESELDTSKTFTSTNPFSAMMSLFKMDRLTKFWKRDNTGEVIKDNNSNITSKINNPDFAKVGDTVTFKLTRLNDEAKEENRRNLEESRKAIAEFRKRNPNGLYSQEDEEFNQDFLAASIGIYSNNELIGFVPVPHFVKYSEENLKDGTYENQLAVRRALVTFRKQILKNIDNAKSTVTAKGAGKLLTRIDKNGRAILNSIPNRNQDNFDNIGLYVYDDGQSIVPFGDIDNLFLKDLDKVEEFQNQFLNKSISPKKIFKVVTSANGSYRLIPVYTTKLNDETINTIVDILKRFNNYTDTVKELQDYVFATSISNEKYKDVKNAIKIDDINKTIYIAGNKFNLDDISQDKSIKVLKESLKTLNHNINGKKINTKSYQDMLNSAGILQTNAYIDTKSGEFFVQPYIEVAPFEKQDNNVNPTIDKDIQLNEDVKDNDITNYNVSEEDVDPTGPYSTVKHTGDLKNAYKVLSRIVPGISFADVEQIAKVKPHVKDAYGMYRNMLIYLFNGATDKTAYHEAFHGVFRNMLSDNTRRTLIKEIASRIKQPTSKDLDNLKNLKGNSRLTKEQLTDLYYEEKLADEFADYIDFKENRSLGRKILDFFKEIFKMFNIFSKYTPGQVETLFDNIYKGKLAKASKLANRTIDTDKFGSTAYARISNNIRLTTQLDRTRSITNQFLAKYNAVLSSGAKLSNKEQENIFEEIREQYKKIFSTTTDKTIKAISAAVYNNFDSFIDEVKKDLEKRKITLVGNLSSTVQDTELGVNEDGESQEQDENLSQGNTSREYGQEMTSISGVKSATHAIKLFLSSIPIIENGKIKKDVYGFDMYHKFETLYYFLERQLASENVITFNEISNILTKASKFRPEYKQILDALDNIATEENRSSLKRQFSSNFSKQVLNYKLVLFQKKNNKYSFKIIDSNRKNIKLELREKWKGNTANSNLQDPSNQYMDKYRYYDTKDSVFKFNTSALEELRKEINTNNYTLEQFTLLTKSLGLDFDTDALELIYEKDKDTLKKNVVAFLSGIIDNTVKKQTAAINRLIDLNITAVMDSFTSSFNNVENSVVYSIQNQSFASKLANKLSNSVTAAKIAEELSKDPLYKNNALLKAAIENPGIYQMFYLDGLKGENEDTFGKKFNQIYEYDYEAIALNMFINQTGNQDVTKASTALYMPIIPAEKSLAAVYQGPKYSVELDENNKVKLDSVIVNQFYNLFLNEAGRIHQALKDKAAGIKPIKNYHYKKNPTSWNGNAFKFHTIEFYNKNNRNNTIEAEIIKHLQDNIEDPNVLANLSRINPDLFNRIRESIKNSLDVEIKSQASKFKKSGVISVEEKGKISSNFIQTTEPLTKVIADYTLNTWLFNVNNAILNNGDPAFYKDDSDLGKRFYQSLSMTRKIDNSLLDNTFKYIKDGKIKFNVVSDYKTSTRSGESLRQLMKGHKDAAAIDNILKDNYEGSDSINATDAQVFVSEGLFKELKRALGDISDSLEIMKPFFYGTQWSKEYNRMIPVQIKCAILPLTDSYVKDNELLKGYKNKMDNDVNYPQAIAFDSAFKAVAPTPGTLNESDSIIDINLESFGIQVDNRDHSIDSDNSSMRQLKMLMYGLMENDEVYIDNGKEQLTGSQIKTQLLELESANLIESNNRLSNMFDNDRESLNTIIKDAVTRRNATSVVESIFELNPDGTFQYNLDLTGHTQVIQMISALFSKRAILQEFNGGAYVQASSLGYRGKNLAEQQKQLTKEELALQTDLEWIKADPNDANSISYVDIAVTAPSEDFYDYINADGTIKDTLPEDLRKMLIYRIPNEGAHSDMVCRIKYILPKGYKNTILMPYEVTKQFGADFDFDKTYFIYKHFTKKKDGSFNIPKYNTTNVDTRYKDYISSVLKYNKKAKALVGEIEEFFEESSIVALKAGKEEYSPKFFKDVVPLLVKEGYIKSLEEFSALPIAQQNTKEARDNRILDLYMGLLRSKNMLKSMITPSGPGEISDFYEKYDMEQDASSNNFFTGKNQVDVKELNHSVSRLKGAIAIHVTGHSWSTNAPLTLKNPIKIYKDKQVVEYDNLSRITSDNGNKITEELSSMMAAILDAVKTPKLLPSIGINDHALNLWATLVRLGVGVELASSIVSQKGVKEYSRGMLGNFRKLKGDKHINYNINDTLSFYKQKYAEVYNDIIKEAGPDSVFANDRFSMPDFVNKSSTLNYTSLINFTRKENSFDEYLNNSDKLTKVDKLNFYKTQIETLNMLSSLENVSGELKQLNSLFSINKEVGPNFEDINQKLIIAQNIKTELESAILGKEVLLANPLIKSYLDIYKSTFNVINEHFMFASKTFNTIKSDLAFAQYGKSNILKLDSEKRELINNITRMFLDASTTFSSMYNNQNDLSENDFIYEIQKILLSVNSDKEDPYQYKLFDGKTLTSEDRKNLRSTGLLSQLKIDSIPRSDRKYLNLKANRLELAEKEMIIASLLSLYQHPTFKKLAENIIKHSFKQTGLFTGLNSYAQFIHPEIAVGLGIQEERNGIKANINNLKNYLNNNQLFERIIDQTIRNYPKKFTKVFDNNNGVSFIEAKDGSITLNMEKNRRLKEILIENNEDLVPIQYLRFMNKDKLVKLFKYDTASEPGNYRYTPVSMLGYQGLYVEINPFTNLEESELPTNNYQAYTKKVKLKDGTSKEVNLFTLVSGKEEENSNEENLGTEKGNETNPSEEGIIEQDVNLYEMMGMTSSNKDIGLNTPLVEESTEEDLDNSQNLPTLANSFTPQEQETILDNYLSKYKIPNTDLNRKIMRTSIDYEIAKNSTDTINKLKECYL